jgi:hypothetical protein
MNRIIFENKEVLMKTAHMPFFVKEFLILLMKKTKTFYELLMKTVTFQIILEQINISKELTPGKVTSNNITFLCLMQTNLVG